MTDLQLCIRSVPGNCLSGKHLQLGKCYVPVQALLRFAAAPDIGQLYSDIRKLMVQTDDIGIHERLCPVHLLTCKIRLRQLTRRFDLLYGYSSVFPGQQAVTAPVNNKQQPLMRDLCLQIDLFAVTFLILLLYMLMNTCPLGHRRTAVKARHKAAAAEYIFHQ
ncbi:hypothetical protein D3C75_513240 [compost metagenome]